LQSTTYVSALPVRVILGVSSIHNLIERSSAAWLEIENFGIYSAHHACGYASQYEVNHDAKSTTDSPSTTRQRCGVECCATTPADGWFFGSKTHRHQHSMQRVSCPEDQGSLTAICYLNALILNRELLTP
jgi:hypothetical protein